MKLAETRGCLVLTAAMAAILFGCGGSSKPPVTPECLINSDCLKYSSTPGSLTCALGYCVRPCTISSDCPGDERCIVIGVTSTDGGADASSATVSDGSTSLPTACEAPEQATCHYTSDCKSPLVCGIDLECRDQCHTNSDCPMLQVCTVNSHLCADPAVDKDYDPTTMDFRNPDGNTFAGPGGSPGTGGGSGTGTGGGSGTGTGGSSSKDAAVDKPTLPPTCAAGLAGFHPSNLPASVAIPSSLPTTTVSTALTFDTDALTLSGPVPDGGQWTTMVVKMSGGYEAAVAFFDTFAVASGVSLSVTGMRPLIIAANGDIAINGSIVPTQSTTNGWYCGGPPSPSTMDRGGLCSLNVLAGGGGAGMGAGFGAGGGGYCGVGGEGSFQGDASASSPGGIPFGSPELIPLAGGASGGSTSGGDTVAYGGGAIELVSGSSVTIGDNGVLNFGGGGSPMADALGGGSGGGILLEAPNVIVRGIVTVNGGAGSANYWGGGQSGQPSAMAAQGAGNFGGNGSAGTTINGQNSKPGTADATGGGGGAGRIRVNVGCGGSFTPSSGAIISPATTTSCFTTGTLQ
jgi:hypothetical protein